MPTTNVISTFAAGTARSGQGTNVGYAVIDAAGTTRIARATAATEDTDAAGNATTGLYRAVLAIDPTWGPVRVKWDITGLAGVAGEDVLGLDPALAGVPPTAAAIAAAVLTDATDTGTAGSLGALIGTVNTNLDAKVSTRNTGNVTVGSYAAGQDPATLVWAASVRTLSAFGFSVTVGTNNDKSGYSLSATPPAAAVVAAAVWDLATAGHATSGSFGSAMVAAGSAGDPWSTALPGSYGAGTAGALLVVAATTLPAGKVVAGSTASVVILSGLPAGSNFAGQKIGPSNGEYRVVATHTYSGGNSVLTLGTGVDEAGPFTATPTTDAVLTMGP